MKKLLLLVLIILGVINTQAQNEKKGLLFTAVNRSYWHVANNDSLILDNNFDEISTFQFNANGSFFIHNTLNMSSVYSIEDLKEDENNENMFSSKVISDAGNEYFLTIYMEKNIISLYYIDNEIQRYVIFNIKSIVEN